MSVPPPTPTQTETDTSVAQPAAAAVGAAPEPNPTTEWDALRAHLDKEPYDSASWNRLIDTAEESGDLERIAKAYDALLQKYPNTSSAQIAYLKHFLSEPKLFPTAEQLFGRFLRPSPSVELWKCYIVYVRRINTGTATRDVVRKAYEFALNHVGQDKDSGEIYAEYIQFLKDGEASTTWEEQQKMDALRKVYHRAVQIPLENVEALWRELDAFENGLNKITAKKFLSELSPAYMTARSTLRELRKHLSVLFPPPAPSGSGRPPLQLPHRPTFTPADRALVGSWKAYLKWEEGNPMDIEDKAVFNQRLQGVYRKATIRMRFYAEIWYMAYIWTASVGKQEEAVQYIWSGLEANPTSFLLNFALAEVLEQAGNLTEVRSLYDKLLPQLQQELEAIEARSAANGVSSSGAGEAAVTHSPPTKMEEVPSGLAAPADTVNGIGKDAADKKEDKPKSKELAEKRQDYSLVWIMYIRFVLRAEGVDASRGVFSKARRDRWATWEVFEAAALMEYHVAKQIAVANKIMGVALGKFPDEIDFVLRYLTFLMSVNDEKNARAIFEHAVATFPPDKARPVWERWGRYEYQYGSLEQALKLEKRMAEAFPNDPPIKRFAQRHTYLSVDGIANRDLGFSLVRQQSTLSSAGSNSSSNLARAETGVSQAPVTPTSSNQSIPPGGGGGGSSKRGPSPERLRREDSKPSGFDHPHKRARPMSPASRDRDRDRDRSDRWDGGSKGRRYGSPAWERDRDRERSPPPRSRLAEREKEDNDKTVLPQILSWFVGSLPPPSSFDGPVFRTDDLMQLFRNAVIPGSARPRSPPPPPPPARSGRPPPDYGPYQGPGGGRGRRH